MQDTIMLFPLPVIFLTFLLFGAIFLAVGNRISSKGEDNPAKHIHYSCGEDLKIPPLELKYHAFFRLALLFGILHIIALAISTIPENASVKRFSILYTISAAICIFILLEKNE